MLAFADELRQAGHTVHTPDLFGGRTFETVAAGVGYAGELGFGEVLQRGVRAAEALPAEVVYAGFSLGVLPAQLRTGQGRASVSRHRGRHGERGDGPAMQVRLH